MAPNNDNNGWIAVTPETMPEKGKWVLLYNGYWTGVGKYQPREDDELPEPVWQDETSEYINPAPTHYQPLPKPPQQ